jgi:acyl-CoA reductase-like NAD-dependent aldehyde dehydrogenase
VLQVEKIEDSIDVVNSKTKPLAAYLFTKNKKLQQDFVANVPAGGMLVNDVALHVTNPFFTPQNSEMNRKAVSPPHLTLRLSSS